MLYPKVKDGVGEIVRTSLCRDDEAFAGLVVPAAEEDGVKALRVSGERLRAVAEFKFRRLNCFNC